MTDSLVGVQKFMEPETSEPLSPLGETLYSKEVKDLLVSLPKDRGMIQTYTYQYQGYRYYPESLQAVIDCQESFQPREKDIILVSAPKSGTTWLKSILYAIMNREEHHPHHPLLLKSPHELVPFFELLKPSEYNSISNSSDTSTRIFACHIPTVSLPKSIMEEESSFNCKIVYLCRDIKDTFVSLFHFTRRTGFRPSPISLEDAFGLFCRGVSPGGPIWDQILGYWKESLERPHKVLFMRYEELQGDPRLQLRRLAQFVGKPFSQEEENSGLIDHIISLCSFENMSKLEVNNIGNFCCGLSNSSFFRSGVVGEGGKYLSAEMAAKLDQITAERFHGSGLSP